MPGGYSLGGERKGGGRRVRRVRRVMGRGVRLHSIRREVVNRMIDAVCHPLARVDPRWVLVDTLLHWLNERDLPPGVRLRKTLLYSYLYRYTRGR